LGFAPWIVYWVLVGNVPFKTAVLVALAVAVLSFVIGRVRGAPGRTLEIGAVATFLILTVLTFTLSESFMERWMQPLSNAGIFLVALIGVLAGRPFVREFAEVDQPKEVVESEVFVRITTLLTWIWVAAFAGMTVSSAIPPIVQGDATILDTKTPLSFVCYWVIPFSLLGLAALASRILPERTRYRSQSRIGITETPNTTPLAIATDDTYLPEICAELPIPASVLSAGQAPLFAYTSATDALAGAARFRPSVTCERIV